MTLKGLIENVFDISALLMFLISAFILLCIDCRDYKKRGFKKEYKVSKFFGIFYIVFGTGMYLFVKLALN